MEIKVEYKVEIGVRWCRVLADGQVELYHDDFVSKRNVTEAVADANRQREELDMPPSLVLDYSMRAGEFWCDCSRKEANWREVNPGEWHSDKFWCQNSYSGRSLMTRQERDALELQLKRMPKAKRPRARF